MNASSTPSSPSNDNSNGEDSFRDDTTISTKIANLPSEKRKLLSNASAEAQGLRRQLASGSHILIVQGGYALKRFIYKRIKELGCTITMLDKQSSPWNGSGGKGVIDHFIEMDFRDNNTVFERAMAAIACSHVATYFDAVTTYYEDGVVLAARIADALGVSINPVEASENARNKRRTREVMAAAGLPAPRFHRVRCATDIAPACAEVGFPAILKPTFGASSVGVARVDNLQDAKETYAALGARVNVDVDEIFAQGTEVVMEEYYDGNEFDVDLLLCNGSVVYAKVLDNWACPESHFQETGRNAPSLFNEKARSEMIALAADTALAMGFLGGVLHAEMKYTSRGARLIEVNARLGGGSDREMHLHVWGIDLAEEHALCSLGIPVRPVVSDRPINFLADWIILAPYSGTIISNDWLEFARDDHRLHAIEYTKLTGNRVQGPEDGLPDRIASIIFSSKNSGREACETVRDIAGKAPIVPIAPYDDSQKKGFHFPGNSFPFVWS